MDIKPFVKRVFKSYRAGSKQPLMRIKERLFEGKRYKVTIFEILKKDLGSSFWDELAGCYRGDMDNGQIVRVEKSEKRESVLVGLMTPYKDNDERQVGSQV